jgi:hypothetical protein
LRDNVSKSKRFGRKQTRRRSSVRTVITLRSIEPKKGKPNGKQELSKKRNRLRLPLLNRIVLRPKILISLLLLSTHSRKDEDQV